MEKAATTLQRTLTRLASNSSHISNDSRFVRTTWPAWLIPAVLAYPLLVAALRFRRINGLLKRYHGNSKNGLAKMTDQEAFEIIQQLSEVEFPAMFEKGLQFALFRSTAACLSAYKLTVLTKWTLAYGIPTISDLLVKTTQLSTSKNVGKRYADTTALVVEIFGNAPASDRSIEGFSRLNYLHGHYIKQGKISNDDMLYTLALFMNSPVEWINKTEWRQLTDMEVCAFGVFHKSMGDAMEIDLGRLPGSQTGWKDGLQFYKELDSWSKAYESKYMVPTRNNYLTAIQTQNLLLSTIPPLMHAPIKNVLSAALDERLRKAIMFEEPRPVAQRFLSGFFGLRRFVLRYLALPRPRLLKSQLINDAADKDGRRTFAKYDTLPIYVKPTLMNRWGPGAWVSRLMGVPLPGDEGMAPEGFLVKDTGPFTFVGKGYGDAAKTAEKLRKSRTGGCPFTMGR